jgi:ABC-2 type transport system ATP-binding protein
MFDEPVNGLDPEGILWIRTLMRDLAAAGRTVFVSSHLMSEMENTADRLVVIGRGRLVADCTVGEFIAANSELRVLLRCSDPVLLGDALRREGARVVVPGDDREVLEVAGPSPRRIGDLAYECGVRVWELTRRQASLEQAYLELTRDSVEFQAREVAA